MKLQEAKERKETTYPISTWPTIDNEAVFDMAARKGMKHRRSRSKMG